MVSNLKLALKIVGITLFASIAIFLAVFSLPFSGWKALSVQTGSMEPAIPAGSLVFVHSIPVDDLRPGDVITYKSKELNGQTITHRLIATQPRENGPTQYIVKGDANKSADAPIYENQIVGRIELSTPFVGHALDALKTPLGLTLTIYIPALLLAIYEIRLLVKRLTKIEVDKQKLQMAPVAAPPLPHIEPNKLHIEKHPNDKSKTKIISVVSAGLLAGSLVIGSTQAQLTSTATLTSNSISAVSPTVDHPIMMRVDFPGALGDPISFQPITYIYNPVRGTTFDMEGWTLEASNGMVFGFRGATPIYPRQRLDVHSGPSGYLRIAGDYLLLKDKQGNVVDAISWGTNTAAFSPAIQGIVARKHVVRTSNTTDTNTAADWEVRP